MSVISSIANNIFNTATQFDDLVSYGTFLRDRAEFLKAGGKSGNEFNRFDTPNQLYFKILFYFWNGDSDSAVGDSGGLLAPTWELVEPSAINTGSDSSANANQKTFEDYWAYNSAWSFLKMNAEDERAELLKQFVSLLSNISTYSPWYFSELEGLDQALARPQIGTDMKIEDQRKVLTIKCLQDAFDNRISTLMDLYRTITWSWAKKCEIVPANLRKFDMGVYIFSAPVTNIHNRVELLPSSSHYASLDPTSSSYITSYKYIEFHNCEFDYNASAAAWGSFSNKEGKMPEFNISIAYDDAYERSYNEFLMRKLGDVISVDTDILISQANPDGRSSTSNQPQTDDSAHLEELQNRVNVYQGGFLETAFKEVGGTLLSAGEGLVNKVLLGNLHTFSLTQAASQIKGLAQGHVISTGRAIVNYVDGKPDTVHYKQNIGNIYKANTIVNNI